MKILIADDNKDACDTLAMLLTLEGHAVETAYDGDTAIRLATTFLPEAAVLDIHMGGKDGFEVAHRLRALRSLRPGALIALTGAPLDTSLPGQEAEFDYFLLKPTSPAQLAALLEAAEIRAVPIATAAL